MGFDIVIIGVGLAILIGAITLFSLDYIYLNKQIKKTKTISQLQEDLEETIKRNQVVKEQNQRLQTDVLNLGILKEETEALIRGKREQLKLLEESCIMQRDQIGQTFANYQDGAAMAYSAWCDALNNQYSEKEKEYDQSICLLEQTYNERQDELLANYLNTSKEVQEHIQSIKADLEKIEKTKAAIMEAQRKELEIKQKLAFYCLSITEAEAADIRVLERIKPELKAPRILSMLIWSTYYQKPMTTLCNNVLGTNIICGIYKITNQKNDCCYIGQAVDVAKRWKEHAKCGLGIDTPANNKLYKAIKEDGLENFSFELLEQCNKEDLNEKERYYIGLYQSKDYGYNSSAGNRKS